MNYFYFSIQTFVLFIFFLSSLSLAEEIHLSPEGNDRHSGGATDPVCTLERAQELWRSHSLKPGVKTVVVYFHHGTWRLEKPLLLNEEDLASSLVFKAAPDAKVILSGSKVLDNWKPWKKNIMRASTRGLISKETFHPGVLFQDDSRLVRARHPNRDLSDPRRGDFFHVKKSFSSEPFSSSVTNLHVQGSALATTFDAPCSGKWIVWMRYAMERPEKIDPVNSDLFSLSMNKGKKLLLKNTPNTGGYSKYQWRSVAKIELKKGANHLEWINEKGNGINVSGFLLTQDASFDPGRKEIISPEDHSGALLLTAINFDEIRAPAPSFSGVFSANAFYAEPGTIKKAWSQPGTELRIFQSGQCRSFEEIVQILNISEQSGLIQITGKECLGSLCKGDRWYLENHLDFLDQVGEWYFDPEEEYLYRVVDPNRSGEVRVAITDSLIQIDCKKRPTGSLTIQGLTFLETGHSREDGCSGYSLGSRGTIEIKGLSGCRIDGCEFYNVGRYPLFIEGGNDHRIQSCTMQHLGQGGILLKDSGRNRVTDNTILDLGEEYKHIAGIGLCGTRSPKQEGIAVTRNVIAHNQIENSSRYAISLKWPGERNIIEFNDIANTNLETYDTGAIEFTQWVPKYQTRSIVRNNRIRNTVGYSTFLDKEIHMAWGIYLDSFSGGYLLENNYISGSSSGGFYSQGGTGNVVRNNIITNNPEMQMRSANHRDNTDLFTIKNNLFLVKDQNAPIGYTGPQLTPQRFRCDDNFYSCEKVSSLKKWPQFQSWQKKGYDLRSTFVKNPLAEPEKENGRIRMDSSILQKGFRPIDLSQVGPRKKPF